MPPSPRDKAFLIGWDGVNELPRPVLVDPQGHLLTAATGSSGAIDQGNPNAGGALSWPTVDRYAQNKFRPGVRTTDSLIVAALGYTTLHTPTAGTRIRVLWIGMSSSQNNGGEVLAKVGFGNPFTQTPYSWYMGNPGAFSHWEPLEGGLNEVFVINLSAGSQSVAVNWTLEEF